MKWLRYLCALTIITAALAATLEANWPQWRGPNLDGTTDTAKNLPVEWDETKNVVWKLETPSWSAATPIIWENTIFITSAEEGSDVLSSNRGRRGAVTDPKPEADKLFLLAVNRKDGSVLWRKLMGEHNRLFRKQNCASPSPVTDGKHVWTMTGQGTFTAFDFKGNQVWQREIQKDYGEFGLNHGYASSPLLHEDRLYVQVLHGMKTDDPSYVFAVDKATGKTIWKVERPTDAQRESPDNYSTPILVTSNGKLQLVIHGGDYVTGHDLDSGKELWRMGGFNPTGDTAHRTIASSITTGGIIFTTSTRGRPFIAFRPGGSGTITGKNEVWKNDLGADVPTPTTDGKLIYVIGDNGVVTSFDAKSGEMVWERQRIEPGTYSASPLLADGKIYATSEDGTTSVLKAGAEFEILATNKLNSFTLASPVADGNQLFIRTSEHLYCIANR